MRCCSMSRLREDSRTRFEAPPGTYTGLRWRITPDDLQTVEFRLHIAGCVAGEGGVVHAPSLIQGSWFVDTRALAGFTPISPLLAGFCGSMKYISWYFLLLFCCQLLFISGSGGFFFLKLKFWLFHYSTQNNGDPSPWSSTHRHAMYALHTDLSSDLPLIQVW